jgi:hypothetical protein
VSAKGASSIVLGLLFLAASAQIDGSASGAFQIRGRVVVTACADHCATRGRRIQEDVRIEGDVLTSTSLLGTCGDISRQDVSDLARFVPARRGRLQMRLLDRKRFVALVGECAGYPSLRLGRIRYLVHPISETAFDARLALAGSLVARGRRVTFAAIGRFHVTRVFEQRSPEPRFRAAGALTTAVARLLGD